MSLLSAPDPFRIVAGQAPIAVGAPHAGSRPGVDADLGTGAIALALAASLGARAVVVSDLRRMVDVNKNPQRLDRGVRAYATRYQNEVFDGGPRLLIEIHGQARGRYSVEVATGFDLDPSAVGDALYLERLRVLRQSLPVALAGRTGQNVSVGVYPLDRDVGKAATNTFTFQKVRRARHLAGVEWYGLHIELDPALRTGRWARSPGHAEALAEGLAIAIRAAFLSLPPEGAGLPDDGSSCEPGREALPPAALISHVFQVVAAPAAAVGDEAVTVHPDDLLALGALDGDAVLLRHGGEQVHSLITPSRTVRPGHVALPARLRHQIGLGPRGRVALARLAPGAARAAAAADRGASVVIGEARRSPEDWVWMAGCEIERTGLRAGRPVLVQGQPEMPPINSVTLQADPALPPRAAAVSMALMDRLGLTCGEVITLRMCG